MECRGALFSAAGGNPSNTEIRDILVLNMARHLLTPVQRMLPRIWALFLLHHFRCSLPELNRTLALLINLPTDAPPSLMDRALPRGFDPKLVDRALKFGRTPDNANFIEVFGTGRYNLYERVSAALPESAPWLFRELLPYCRAPYPHLAQSTRLVDQCLARQGFRRMDASVIEGASALHKSAAELADDLLPCGPDSDPTNLVLLLALLHERQWDRFNNKSCENLFDLCMDVINRLLASEVFHWNEVARKYSADFQANFFEVFHNVLENGRHVHADLNLTAGESIPKFVIAVRADDCTAALENCVRAGFEDEALHAWHSLPSDRLQTRVISVLLDVAAGRG